MTERVGVIGQLGAGGGGQLIDRDTGRGKKTEKRNKNAKPAAGARRAEGSFCCFLCVNSEFSAGGGGLRLRRHSLRGAFFRHAQDDKR